MDPREHQLTRDDVARAVADRWPAATKHWSRFLLLSEPIDDSDQHAIAQIDMAVRKVSLNYAMIADKDLLASVEAILAHEVGHHVRYPGSLAVEARLRLLERQLLPFPNYSLVNHFEDLLINERLGRTMRDELAAVYKAFNADAFAGDVQSRRDPAFSFYMVIYEELWRLRPGELLGPVRDEFAAMYPNYRADAQLLAQDLFNLGPNIYTQFVYFLSVMIRYVDPPSMGPATGVAHECGRGDPTPDDWAEALSPNAREREALERAIREGWLNEAQRQRISSGDLEDRIAGLPGFGTAEAQLVPEVMAAFYRQQAERYLFRPPKQRMLGEAIVPTTSEDWEVGDPVRDIDWLTTLLRRGDQLGAAAPMKRTKVAEYEGYDVSFWQPRVEIYLDVSGSMPNPTCSKNAMTLAAQILVAGTVRAGGWVRAALYSGDTVAYWEWCRSEVEMSRFLMHYIGGGTDFPFARLDESVAECGNEQPIRVVITDPDFDRNYDADATAADVVLRAASASPQLILLLHHAQTDKISRYRNVGATVIEVADMEDFPKMAADLTFALFPDGFDVTD
jgi:hypothetical protein